MQKVIVTGGAGFIGSNLVDKLVTDGFDVIVIDNESAECNEQFYYNNNAQYFKYDIEDYDLIAAEDYDCWLRIAKLTDKFTRIPKSLGYYWAGGGNISNPERTIENADAIELRYLDNKCTGNNGSANWIQYSRGRAYYLMRNWELAKKHLSNIGWLGTPFNIYIKSQWMLQFIRWAHENKP